MQFYNTMKNYGLSTAGAYCGGIGTQLIFEEEEDYWLDDDYWNSSSTTKTILNNNQEVELIVENQQEMKTINELTSTSNLQLNQVRPLRLQHIAEDVLGLTGINTTNGTLGTFTTLTLPQNLILASTMRTLGLQLNSDFYDDNDPFAMSESLRNRLRGYGLNTNSIMNMTNDMALRFDQFMQSLGIHNYENGVTYVSENIIDCALQYVLETYEKDGFATHYENITTPHVGVLFFRYNGGVLERIRVEGEYPLTVVCKTYDMQSCNYIVVSPYQQTITLKITPEEGTPYTSTLYLDQTHYDFEEGTLWCESITGGMFLDNMYITPIATDPIQTSTLTRKEIYSVWYGEKTQLHGITEDNTELLLTVEDLLTLANIESQLGRMQWLATKFPEWFDNALEVGTVSGNNLVNRLWLPLSLPQQFLLNNRSDLISGYEQPLTNLQTQNFTGLLSPTELTNIIGTTLEMGLKNLVLPLNTINLYEDVENPLEQYTETGYTYPVIPDNIDRNGKGTTPAPVLPTGGTSDFGKVYIPTMSQVTALNQFLWSDLFSLDTFKKIFQNPIEAIVGLTQIYYTPTITGQAEIILGNIGSGVTGVDYTTTRFYHLSCGKVKLDELYGNAIDYYSNVSIFLPFIGIVNVDIDLLMRCSSIEIVYDLDILGGCGNCKILGTRDGQTVQLYTFGCQTSSQYPLSGSNFTGMLTAIGSAVATIVTGGATAPLLVGTLANAKSHIQQSGGYGANTGALGNKKPYIIIKRALPNMSQNYELFKGQPYHKVAQLGNCTGFTIATDLHLDTTDMLYDDIAEIENMLNNGVIL